MQYTTCFWDELTTPQIKSITAHAPQLHLWLGLKRARSSTILTLWNAEMLCGYSVMTHDRIAISGTVIDVATIRLQQLERGVPPEYAVELAMTQAGVAHEEGIGIVLVQGQVTDWSLFGFAPISFDARTTWTGQRLYSQPQPGTTQVGPADESLQRLLADMSRARPTGAIDIVEWDRPIAHTWFQIYGRDGQLRAAARIESEQQSVVCRQAVASDDAAAGDLVDALCAAYGAPALQLRTAPTHPLTRMALFCGANTSLHVAMPDSVLAGIIDLPTMLHALIPVFRMRIAASRYRDWVGGVRIEISDERAMIMLNAGEVTIIDGTREAAVRIRSVELSALVQLCFGYRSVSALRRAGLLACDDTELALCELLFPTLTPVLPEFRD